MASALVNLLVVLALGVGMGLGAAVCPSQCCPSGGCDCSLTLACADRGLTAVPSGTFEGTQTADLDNNDIAVLGSLSGFPQLRMVSLSNNHLTMLDLEQFNATEVATIFAPNNLVEYIYRLPYNMALPHLQALYLQRNRIGELKADDLFGVSALRRLALDMNPLRALPPAAVAGHVAAGAEISFSNTPLACACAYGALKEWADAEGVTLQAQCGARAPCDQLTN